MLAPSQRRLIRPIGIGTVVLGALLAGVFYFARTRGNESGIDPGNRALVAQGRVLYERTCAACHGLRLEGTADWQKRLPSGRLPPPPHDDTGHTWHHPDQVLFEITKYGLVPPNAPADYQSDMPAFGSGLSDDEIRAVLAYIKSRWPAKVMQWRSEALMEGR